MKLSKKIFIILFLSFVILTGCSNPLVKTDQKSQEKSYSCSCDDLKIESNRTDCMMQIKNIALDAISSEIFHTFDLKRCVELPQEMADECAKNIQETGVKGPITSEQLQALYDAMELTYKTTQGPEGESVSEGEGYYDLTKCKQFTTPGLKEYCEKQLNRRIEDEKVFQIVRSGDVTKCEELTGEYKDICKMELGVEVQGSEITEPPMAEENIEPAEGEVMP